MLLNLFSVAASYGLLVLIWQHGYGSEAIWGVPATGAVTFWVPLMVFAFLYGLSMDYEVFILARMREEYDRTGSTRTAVVDGLARTGRLVTSAALILFLAFVSLATAPDTDDQNPGHRRSVPASCSTRRWCAACWSPRRSLCSAGGTGGCRPGRRRLLRVPTGSPVRRSHRRVRWCSASVASADIDGEPSDDHAPAADPRTGSSSLLHRRDCRSDRSICSPFRPPHRPAAYHSGGAGLVDGVRYLIQAYPESDWVRNARAAGRGILSRGHRAEEVDLVQLPTTEAAAVLRAVSGAESPRRRRVRTQRAGRCLDSGRFRRCG